MSEKDKLNNIDPSTWGKKGKKKSSKSTENIEEDFDPETIPMDIRNQIATVLAGRYSQYVNKDSTQAKIVIEMWNRLKLDEVPPTPVPDGLKKRLKTRKTKQKTEAGEKSDGLSK